MARLGLEQGCLGTTSAGNTGQEIPGNTVREIRDRPVNTGKYIKKKKRKEKKTLFEYFFFFSYKKELRR